MGNAKKTINQKIAHIERQIAVLSDSQIKARHGIPAGFSCDSDVAPTIIPDGFSIIDDEDSLSRASEALKYGTYHRIMDALSSAFDCDKSQICVTDERTVTRSGVKMPVMFFWYTYNPAVNDMLMSEGCGRFHPQTKAWTVPLGGDEIDAVSGRLQDHFSVIIDMAAMRAMKSDAGQPVLAMSTMSAFSAMPYQVGVSMEDIFPDGLGESERLYVHNGESFVRFPERAVIWTQSPFLLLRYSIPTGKPRYISYSTIAKRFEAFSYHDSKQAAMAIARFIDACRVNRIPGFSLLRSDASLETPELKRQLQGSVDRFDEELNGIQSIIPDFRIAILCSDYVSLTQRGYGADLRREGVLAYVAMSEKMNNYLSKISMYFGYSGDEYPVVFSREYLDECANAPRPSESFKQTAIHEVAHHLVGEMEISDTDAHGVAWVVCNDLIEYIASQGRNYGISVMYLVYAGESDESRLTAKKIGHLVAESGSRLLREAAQSGDGRVFLADIKTAAMDCISLLSL